MRTPKKIAIFLFAIVSIPVIPLLAGDYLISQRRDGTYRVDEVAPGHRATGYSVVVTSETAPTQEAAAAALAPKLAEKTADQQEAAAVAALIAKLQDGTITAAEQRQLLRRVVRRVFKDNGEPRR